MLSEKKSFMRFNSFSIINIFFYFKRRREKEEDNVRSKQERDNNSLDKPPQEGSFSSTTMLWTSSGNTYGGGTYVPIPEKSEHTYLTVRSASDKNSNQKEAEEENAPDTRRLILRYSGTSMESEPTISPPSTISSSSLMTLPSDKLSSNGYLAQQTDQLPRSSFPGSDVSLTSLYGKDSGIYASILSDLEPRHVGHALAEAPTKRRSIIGHCI